MKLLAQVDIGTKFFGTNGGAKLQSLTNVADLVSLFVKIAFVLAGLIILFYFLMGGIGMISSAGKDDPKQLEQAKQTLTTAVLGFVIVFLAYWIVKLILQVLGIQNII